MDADADSSRLHSPLFDRFPEQGGGLPGRVGIVCREGVRSGSGQFQGDARRIRFPDGDGIAEAYRLHDGVHQMVAVVAGSRDIQG